MVAGSQSSTDSKRCLAAVRQQGFGSPFQAQAQPKRPLQRIGITLPEQEKKSEPAPDGVLTRVDVAGRHLGYGLCYHETRETRETTPFRWLPFNRLPPQEYHRHSSSSGALLAFSPSLMYSTSLFGRVCSVAQSKYRKRFFWAPVLYGKRSRPSITHTNDNSVKVDLGFYRMREN